jgi:hypothetical protein
MIDQRPFAIGADGLFLSSKQVCFRARSEIAYYSEIMNKHFITANTSLAKLI